MKNKRPSLSFRGVWAIPRLVLFVLAMILVGLNGFHWASLLFFAAGLLCFPGTPARMLMDKIRLKEGLAVLLAAILILTGGILSFPRLTASLREGAFFSEPASSGIALADLPVYAGEPYVEIHGNEPFFTENEITAQSFETYAPLDWLGRCGVCTASIGRDLMPTAPRESLYEVKPTGWQSIRYDFIDGESLYNRCHLIGFQLTAENANPNNLITGTRYLNTEGMLPFENRVAEYVRETGNHVLYRVTPLFSGLEQVSRGVLIEAESVEDGGEGVLFCVFCYNVQPGVVIDYATGAAHLS